MLKIGDFSKLTHVSVRMLRYYDNQGLLKPSYVDPATGYRMYSVEQVPILQKIVLLRDLNFGVSEIAEVLQNLNDDYLVQRLHDKIKEAEGIIESEKIRIQQIRAAVTHIHDNEFEKCYNVTIKSVPTYRIVSLRRKMNSYFEEGKLWVELLDFVRREHIEIDNGKQNNIAIYHDKEHMDSDVDIEVCLIVKKLGKSKDDYTYRELNSVDRVACMMVYGPYENLTRAYQSFVVWLENNQQYSIGGTARQVTIIDHQDTDNPDEYLTEIQIPLVQN